jgi:hypothetical protein
MTEQEWLSCTDPQQMLEFLLASGEASERRVRLLAAACCRYLGDWLDDEKCRHALEIVEGFADGKASKAALKRARQSVRAVRHGLRSRAIGLGGEETASWQACWIMEVAAAENAYVQAPLDLLRSAHLFLDEAVRMNLFLGELIRDVFGNPLRPVTIDHLWMAWNDGTIPKIAQAIYDERAFDRLPILADALEDAGCTNDDILNHCRQPGEHVRGCWVIDLILAKK